MPESRELTWTNFTRWAKGFRKMKNQAIFTVKTTVVLDDVSDAELNNSEVLHPDVLNKLWVELTLLRADCEITLDEVLELD